MFEPLQELARGDADAFIEDARLLGEKCGKLCGSSEQAEYTQLGGALYPLYRAANAEVVTLLGSSSRRLNTTGAARGKLSKGDAQSEDTWEDGDGEGARGRCHAGLAKNDGGLCVAACILWKLPGALALQALRVATAVLPMMRMAFPSAVPSAKGLLCAASSSGAAGPERVRTVAFHPYLMLLAVAVDEGSTDGSTRVVVYNAEESRVECVLTHAFQKSVFSLAWKPMSKDVLAVGCKGGVLLWMLTFGSGPARGKNGLGRQRLGFAQDTVRPSPDSVREAEAVASCLFYRCARGVVVTSLAFSCLDGRYLACGSAEYTRLYVLDITRAPNTPASVVSSAAPTVNGGIWRVTFSDDDTFVISAISRHPSLVLTKLGLSNYGSVSIGTPAPVLHLEKAVGVGINCFVMHTQGLEGVMVARINPFIGVEVLGVISTAVCRGVGGCVRTFACSKRRLWIAVETGHLVVCRYGYRERHVTLTPIGVAAMNVSHLSSFQGCAAGSLAAVVEDAETITFVPSYHS